MVERALCVSKGGGGGVAVDVGDVGLGRRERSSLPHIKCGAQTWSLRKGRALDLW